MKDYIKISMSAGKWLTLLLIVVAVLTHNVMPLVVHLMLGMIAAQMVFQRKEFNAQRDLGFVVRCIRSGLPVFIAVLVVNMYPKEI